MYIELSAPHSRKRYVITSDPYQFILNEIQKDKLKINFDVTIDGETKSRTLIFGKID